MKDKDFQKLLDQASKAAIKHRELMKLVGEACIDRFGYHYSDLDVDCLIDTIDHGLGPIKVSDVDEAFEWSIKNKGLELRDSRLDKE